MESLAKSSEYSSITSLHSLFYKSSLSARPSDKLELFHPNEEQELPFKNG
jgi:hypothetical protein